MKRLVFLAPGLAKAALKGAMVGVFLALVLFVWIWSFPQSPIVGLLIFPGFLAGGGIGGEKLAFSFSFQVLFGLLFWAFMGATSSSVIHSLMRPPADRWGLLLLFGLLLVFVLLSLLLLQLLLP